MIVEIPWENTEIWSNVVTTGCEWTLLELLQKEWNFERLTETDTVRNLISSFAVDHRRETMLIEHICNLWLDLDETIDISSFVMNLDKIKKTIDESRESSEWIDNIMGRVRNYVVYWASNKTE